MIEKENAQDRGLRFKQEETLGTASVLAFFLLKKVSHITNVLTFKRVLFSLCVPFLKSSTTVANIQITHYVHDPIGQEDMKGYSVLTPNQSLLAPTCGPETTA